MRRKDREMNKEFAYEVIDRSNYGVVSLIDENNEPYAMPLSIVRKEARLYFHSAKDGKKVSLFDKSPPVWVSFVGETHIPENYTKEELEEIARDKSKTKLLISKVFTTQYESAMVKGRINLVEDQLEKRDALKLICNKYTPRKIEYADLAIETGIGRVNVYRIEIDEVTGKRKKYDLKGEEMKWGRME